MPPIANTPVRSARSLLLLALATAAVSSAVAQVPAPFHGNWKANWQTERKLYEAAMQVNASGGTWQTFTRDKDNPCAGREVPMRLDAAAPTEVQFTLMFSDVIPGCANAKVRLSAASDGTVTGLRSKHELKLVRQ